MRPPNPPLFLPRENYRRRRVIDAIKLVPVLGALLFLIPVLNMSESASSTLKGSVYLFLSWFGLIVLSAVLSRKVNTDVNTDLDAENPGGATGKGTP